MVSASAAAVTGATASATYIAPIRNVTQTNVLGYNTTTNEVTYYQQSSSSLMTNYSNPTSVKQTNNYSKLLTTTINTKDIFSSIDNPVNYYQEKTIGPSITNLWLAGGNIQGTVSTASIAYSTNGNNWLPINGTNNIFNVCCYALEWSGTLWVAGGETTGAGTNPRKTI